MLGIINAPDVDFYEQTTYEPKSKNVECYSTGEIASFTFAQKVFMLEKGVSLEFHQPFKCRYTTTFIEIPEIGLIISKNNVSNIDKEVSRQFIKLYSKAQSDSLSDKEKIFWMNLVDSIDYRKLSQKYSRPFYVEGLILSKKDGNIQVQWHDGEQEWICGEIANALSLWEENEKFGAFVKQDCSGKTILVENITYIEDIDVEGFFESLPKAELEPLD